MRMFYKDRASGRKEAFDFVVFGDDDEVLFTVDGYETVKVQSKI